MPGKKEIHRGLICLMISAALLLSSGYIGKAIQSPRAERNNEQDGLEPPRKGKWIYTGGPVGGLGYDVRMRPDNPDIMFVTDAWAGVFKSIDGGKTWFPSNKGITTRLGPSGDSIPVFCLTIDPNNPDIVWAGTQYSSDVYCSDDSGKTWKLKNKGIEEKQFTSRGFTVEPGNSDVVYMAGEISSIEWNNGEALNGKMVDLVKGAVYKTTNRGKKWKRIWTGDNLARYIWIHPENHDILYVSTGIFDREAANSKPDKNDPGGVGLLRSKDGGKTWEVLNGNGLNSNELYFGSLYMHPTDPDILIAASGLDPYAPNGGVFLSEDGGDTWIETLDYSTISSVEISDTEPSIVYAGSVDGFFRSFDGGHTWEQLSRMSWGSEDTVAGFPIDMQCDPRNPLRIFVNNYGGGNFLSEDGGETWVVASKGYTGALISQISVYPGNPDIVYASARSGVFRSMDGGKNWEGMSRGIARAMECIAMAVDPSDPEHIIATVLDAGRDPKESSDGGRTWQDRPTGLWSSKKSDTYGMVTQIIFKPGNSRHVFATVNDFEYWRIAGAVVNKGEGLLLSTNGGRKWRRTNLKTGNVMDLAISPIDNSIMYAAVFKGGIYRGQKAGKRWDLVIKNPYPPDGFAAGLDDESKPGVVSLAVDPFNIEKIYAGFENGGVAISMDQGETWKSASAGMPLESTVRAFACDPTKPGSIYAATFQSGVYHSTDGGKKWKSFNSNLLTRTAMDIEIDAEGRVLYLATYGAGVFRYNLRSK